MSMTCTRPNPFPTPGNPDFSRSGKSAAEFAQEPSQFARMAPGPSRRRGRLAPPTPRIWLTAGALLAVACQGGGERPLETSAGLSLAPWGLAEPAAATARASEPVIAQQMRYKQNLFVTMRSRFLISTLFKTLRCQEKAECCLRPGDRRTGRPGANLLWWRFTARGECVGWPGPRPFTTAFVPGVPGRQAVGAGATTNRGGHRDTPNRTRTLNSGVVKVRALPSLGASGVK